MLALLQVDIEADNPNPSDPMIFSAMEPDHFCARSEPESLIPRIRLIWIKVKKYYKYSYFILPLFEHFSSILLCGGGGDRLGKKWKMKIY